MTSSRIGRPLFQTVYLYIPNFRIKSLFNQVFKLHPEEIFSFIYIKVKNGSDNLWNIETLIELKQFIDKMENNGDEEMVDPLHNKDEKAVLTEKTLSL